MNPGAPRVPVLVLPVFGAKLLVPSRAVVEILGYGKIEPGTGSHPWLAGTYGWRGAALKLLRLGDEVPPPRDAATGRRRSIVAVLRSLDESADPAHYAVLLSTPPRALEAVAEAVRHDHGNAELPPFSAMAVIASGIEAHIANLDALQAVGCEPEMA